MSIYYRCPKCGSSYLAAGANAKFGGCMTTEQAKTYLAACLRWTLEDDGNEIDQIADPKGGAVMQRQLCGSYPGALPWQQDSSESAEKMAVRLCEEAGCSYYAIDGVTYDYTGVVIPTPDHSRRY